MNKKVCGIMISIFLLMASICFASEYPRNASYESVGKSVYSNLAVTGIDQYAVPGYIEFTNGNGNIFYLWVGLDGQLRISSDIVVGAGASPSIIIWRESSGTIVGAQR